MNTPRPRHRAPEVIVAEDAAEAGRLAARVVLDAVAASPAAVLGLATGSSPLPLYAALAASGADFSEVSGFALDEYIGLPDGHPQSYAEVIRTEVVERLGLDPARVRTPDPHGADHAEHERRADDYDAAIAAAGGVDVQILGVGSNGHIGFNEPPSAFDSRTRVVPLAESTRRDNARFFDGLDEVPTECITQGIATIMEARHLLLIAHGARKAEAVRRALQGPVTEDFPASIVQRHPRVTVVLDREAAALLG
ncbi:glucosamine-6-phosphate deaminase [Zafaria sp. Z1313]|uniref:glucosamine-6-phosphate deaminase n=1 Tax=unclassified Zafaria TaxID=2828765 RepID=UPI002E78D5BA|nr:glucosamine-6-phosphate deaminase [Zafaria sp. J156]MEE1621585.1 glucosamine-6-phosphate deaminase [Zafaria sp. J156]